MPSIQHLHLMTYKTVDIRTDRILFDLMPSGLFGPATHRGGDDVVPEKAGRYRRNRVPDVRELSLPGFIRGVGSTVASRQADFREVSDIFWGLLDPDVVGNLVVMGPYMGLGATEEATVACYPKNWVEGPPMNSLTFQRFSVVLEAVDVDWAYES